MSAVQTRYPSSTLEEELKNKVAVDWFGAFDCSRILGTRCFNLYLMIRAPRQPFRRLGMGAM